MPRQTYDPKSGLPTGPGTLYELCGGDVRLVRLLQRWGRRYGRYLREEADDETHD